MPIIIIGIILIIFGLLAIYSVSIHESFTLTLKLIASGKRTDDPSNYFYFLRQLKNIAIAVIMALGVYIFPIKIFQKNRNIVIIGVFLMLLQILVFVPGIGMVLNGARGWISLPLLPSMQPSEFFKLGYVFFLSSWLIKKRDIANQKQFFSSFIVINIILLFIFLLIPDLGTLLILGLTGLTLCRYIGIKFKYIMFILFGTIISGILVGTIAGSISPKFDYIQKRFTYFLNPNVDEQKRGIGRQNEQALMAIGGGGFLGKGYGKGLQKFGYIPEAQSDFVFAAYSEEIGFVGNLILLGLYFYLAYYFLSRLHTIKNEHSKTIGVGIISLIIIQAFINIGVNLKIMPNTGLTLPFISYGGTALMVNCIEIILLYKILKEK
ncbi:MAG: FtsW/RodA/SpoVE family cell cycle protein [Candidatus Absconditabacteria bacterium]|nr:FtsW/RodA/SpoVE family cell cycle protein [Candidatus Absconditabacteria bacterium]